METFVKIKIKFNTSIFILQFQKSRDKQNWTRVAR